MEMSHSAQPSSDMRRVNVAVWLVGIEGIHTFLKNVGGDVCGNAKCPKCPK